MKKTLSEELDNETLKKIIFLHDTRCRKRYIMWCGFCNEPVDYTPFDLAEGKVLLCQLCKLFHAKKYRDSEGY